LVRYQRSKTWFLYNWYRYKNHLLEHKIGIISENLTLISCVLRILRAFVWLVIWYVVPIQILRNTLLFWTVWVKPSKHMNLQSIYVSIRIKDFVVWIEIFWQLHVVQYYGEYGSKNLFVLDVDIMFMGYYIIYIRKVESVKIWNIISCLLGQFSAFHGLNLEGQIELLVS
jgi:hypothetical protein